MPARTRKPKMKRRKRTRADHTIARSLGAIVADETIVKLKFPAVFTLINGAAGAISRVFTPTAAYDVDPTLGSTSTPGFAEWANFYIQYRVTHYRVVTDLVNKEAFGVNCYSINVNANPGTTGANYFDAATAKYGKHQLLAAKGGIDKVRFVHSVKTDTLVGSKAPLFDDNYAANVNAVPANLLFYGIGLQSVGGSFLTNGVEVSCFIEMTVRFYERKSILTSFSRETFELNRQMFKARKVSEGTVPPPQ